VVERRIFDIRILTHGDAMDIDWIIEKVSKGEYEFRKHALERGTLRKIK